MNYGLLDSLDHEEEATRLPLLSSHTSLLILHFWLLILPSKHHQVCCVASCNNVKRVPRVKSWTQVPEILVEIRDPKSRSLCHPCKFTEISGYVCILFP